MRWDLEIDVPQWARRFALVNPHATVAFDATDATCNYPGSGDGTYQGHSDPAPLADSYKPMLPNGWSKPLPTDPTSPHRYDATKLTSLVWKHIAVARQGGPDVPLGEFIRLFAGLTSPVKAKAVRASVPGITRLSDFMTIVDSEEGARS